jgi:hypothetical protein
VLDWSRRLTAHPREAVDWGQRIARHRRRTGEAPPTLQPGPASDPPATLS